MLLCITYKYGRSSAGIHSINLEIEIELRYFTHLEHMEIDMHVVLLQSRVS